MAINLSSKALFHFTPSLKRLVSILRTGIFPCFCLEDFSHLAPEADDSPVELAFPIACFCDIPLRQASDHMSSYGSYGIGLSKQWAMKNGITPVTYVHQSSPTVQRLLAAVQRLESLAGTLPSMDSRKMVDILDQLWESVAFFKAYEGRLWRRGRYTGAVRFYDEREWRYSPHTKQWFYRFGMPKDHFIRRSIRHKADLALRGKHTLTFDMEDLEYVLVAHSQEIEQLLNSLCAGKRAMLGPLSRDSLVGKLFATEQVFADF